MNATAPADVLELDAGDRATVVPRDERPRLWLRLASPELRGELLKLAGLVLVFALFFWLPVGTPRFDNAVAESMHLARAYAREHVLLCLVPALFIAGAIGVFVSQASVMRFLGPRAPKPLAYGVASVSGTILAVCSCTVLPLFAGIWRMGAGLGPATAFLYAGPAVNVLAIVLTARVLGAEIGIARAIGAVGFSVVIGLLMHLIYRREERARVASATADGLATPDVARPLWQTATFFGLLIAVLVFANWGVSEDPDGLWMHVHAAKWWITSAAAALLAVVLVRWIGVVWWKMALAGVAVVATTLAARGPELPFIVATVALVAVLASERGEPRQWLAATWSFAKQIVPLLFVGVLIAGLLLGRPGNEGLIPNEWVARSVGGNSPGANLFAAAAGALMYFATLTEVPIIQGLTGSGMGKGPALALLLAGPALSLPSMLVLRTVMGGRKTLVYVCLVVLMASLCGLVYGTLF